MKYISKIILSCLFLCTIFLPGIPVQAASLTTGSQVALQNPIKTTNIREIVGNGVKVVLGIMGSLTLAAFVYGGYQWLTSAGNSDKVQTGTHALMYATIGLFIIFGAYAILNTILTGIAK